MHRQNSAAPPQNSTRLRLVPVRICGEAVRVAGRADGLLNDVGQRWQLARRDWLAQPEVAELHVPIAI